MNFSFTDFQKATLIWNAPDKSRQAILDTLREVAERTQDDNTKKQIKERLKYEEKVYEMLIHNPSGAYVYVVEDEETVSCGFFAEYDRAVKYAIKYMQKYDMKCLIKKQRIVLQMRMKLSVIQVEVILILGLKQKNTAPMMGLLYRQ